MFDPTQSPERSLRHALTACACTCLVLLAPALHAQNLNFLKPSPIARFTQDDVDLMMSNADEVLEAKEPAAKKEWSNPKTGASGMAEVTGEFVGSDGAPCKRLRVVNKAKNDSTDVTHTVCKYEGRGWLLHSAATPAPKGN